MSGVVQQYIGTYNGLSWVEECVVVQRSADVLGDRFPVGLKEIAGFAGRSLRFGVLAKRVGVLDQWAGDLREPVS